MDFSNKKSKDVLEEYINLYSKYYELINKLSIYFLYINVQI